MQRTSSGVKVSNYLQRSREVDDALTRESEVAYYSLHTNGLDIDAKAIWAEVDRLSRNRHGFYKTHAGRLPRLGIFITAALPRGLSKDEAIEAVECFAKAMTDKFHCSVEAVIHVKNGQYDHAHVAIVDRRVGPEGVAKTKIREFNGVSEKAEGRGIQDKGRKSGAGDGIHARNLGPRKRAGFLEIAALITAVFGVKA